MKKTFVATLLLLGALLIPLAASAAQIRVYVADFIVSSAESGDLKTTLKRLLSSRLTGTGITTAESPSEADVIVTGSFTQLGKIYSLDATAKSAAGKTLSSAFQQGESLDSLIPALGKISENLKADLAKVEITVAEPVKAPVTAQTPTARQQAVPAPRPSQEQADDSQIIRKESTTNWTSQRIDGAQQFLAPVNPKEYLMCDGNAVRLYRQSATALSIVAEAKIPMRQKVLGIDSLGPDQGGKTLVVVTTVDGESPASRIYELEHDTLKLVAQDLPYLFRTISLNGGAKRLYAQQMGRTEDYYGDLYEASFSEGSVKVANPVKLPRFANIFNFNTFKDQTGKVFLTAFTESGYLIVYSDKGEELWRSADRFGGSEASFQRRDPENERSTGTPFRTRFIDPRIIVTENGEIIVPQNSGFFVLGNARSFTNYSLVSLAWNGSSLEERWRTKQVHNYLTDFFYQPASKELVLLEIVQKAGVFGKGGSALRLVRAE